MIPAATNAAPVSSAGTILAFDFGTRRTGVAVGEASLGLAHPLTTIDAQDDDERLAAIAALIAEWRPSALVVGLPTHADGMPHQTTARARSFAQRLESRFGLDVALVDERYTSEAADAALCRVAARKRKPLRDRVAAQIILQAWFDQHRA